MRTLTLAVWLICSVAWGQITVPDESEVGDQLIASVNASVPPGATFEGGWSIQCDVGCTASYAALEAENSIGIWAKNAGSYRIEYRGYWVLLGPEITVKDVNGDEQTFQPFLGSGLVNESATFTITGGDDGGDDPDPPNPTEGPWQIVLFHDLDQLDNLPSQQRLLLSSLKVRKDLATLGHVFREVVERRALDGSVPERIKGFADSVSGDPLPRIAIAPVEGGKVLDYPLPASYNDLVKLLDNPPEVK